MTNALIISTGYEPEYLRIIEQIALEISKEDLTPVILDLGPIMTSPTESYSPTLLKLSGIRTSAEIFKPRLADLGYRVITAKIQSENSSSLSTEAEQVLNDATQSALFTYFRTDILNFRNPRVRKVQRRLKQEGTSSYQVLTALLEGEHFARAFVPNGRFPVQRMAKLALTSAGVQVFHFEKGATKDHAFYRPYSPHDRIATQLDVDSVLDGLAATEIDEVADAWLTSRLPSQASSNEYSAIWNETPTSETSELSGVKKIGFFTSSQDEFLHLGPDWQLHSWESQFQAFDLLIAHFEAQGYECFMRVHPNLSTKDHSCFKREVEGLNKLISQHPALKVYWHDDATSSYSLFDSCAGIVVWDSTVGLEASARGIPVWNCAASYYGLVADSRQVLGPKDIDSALLTPWKVNAHQAKRFIACSVLRDLPLSTSPQDWADWDLSAPPLSVQLASLVRSGGAPTFFDSVLVTLDPWRHRSFKVNRKLFKAKFAKLRAK